MARFRVIREGNGEGAAARASSLDGGPLPFAELDASVAACLESSKDMAAIEAVNLIVTQAVCHRASDLHLEPWGECLAVRFRIDGILHEAARIPKVHQAKVIARIKILARMIVYQRDLPQDGRIEPEDTPAGQPMRVSTFPTVDGEKAVIRVLGAQAKLIPLDDLGFREDVLAGLRAFVRRPQGVLLLTGPSSSGKTTTIYALLSEILDARHPTPHIMTVEDPVEFRLDRVSQTEVRPHAGFTFEKALRGMLRQDPEVIVIGEIRDPETARTAIQAGLTGHLVISTIHCGTAAGVFSRLLDMGIEPFLIGSSVTAVLAQRLVRRLCPACTAPAPVDPDLATRFGFRAGEMLPKGAGCPACQGIGYQGRTALAELLMMSPELGDLIQSRPRTSVIHEMALRGHMTTLAGDGVRRVGEAVTTLEELGRVLPPEQGVNHEQA